MLTLDYSVFDDRTAEGTSRYIRDHISMKLEDRTDYFKGGHI
ncbi:hypothetical protein [Arthrobacter terrae]|nr:hypothetical protein [Arthrobacter terrae]